MADWGRLSASDNTFLDLEKYSTHMHVAATTIFHAGPLAREGGGVDIDRLRDYLASRLHFIRRYRQKLARIPVVDHPVWIDDAHFNIEYHVRHTCLSRPQVPLYMLGAPMTAIYPMVNLLENHGLGVALFSYSGKLFWGVLGDWDLTPDLVAFVTAIRSSIDELRRAARRKVT